MCARPIIKLQKSRSDQIMEVLIWSSVLVQWIYTAISYPRLPDIIPIHYNLEGEIDGYGSKATIWLIPVIVTFIITGMHFINKNPHILNYTEKITEENARSQYTTGTRLIRVMEVMIAFFFLLINFDIIHSATTKESLFDIWLVPVFILCIIAPTVIVWLNSHRKT